MTTMLLGALLAASLGGWPGAQSPPDPDLLYAARETPGRAAEAASLWEVRLSRRADDFEAAWKLARTRYWLGTQGPAADRRSALEAGVEAGRTALGLRPERPEGHFWMAANMGALAESFGLRQGLRYRGDIRAALERVLAIDPAYQDGSADRALGRWYAKVPGLFGGSDEKAERHLKRSLAYNPDSTASLFFLAELYLDDDRRGEARALLQRVLDVPLDPDWAPEDRDFKRRAARLLATLDR